MPPRIEHTLFEIRLTGRLPVMAHPERYQAIQDDPGRAEAIGRSAALVMDLGALDGAHGRPAMKAARKLVEEGGTLSEPLVDVVTDAVMTLNQPLYTLSPKLTAQLVEIVAQGSMSKGPVISKGDRLVQEAHKLLRQSALNFIGNAEPKDALSGSVCDVLVCDGFVGNMFIKHAQAVLRLALELGRDEVGRGLPLRLLPSLLAVGGILWLGWQGVRQAGLFALIGLLGAIPALLGNLLIPALARVRRKADYRSYGGGPLLGVKGVAIVAHGKSDAAAIASAIRQAVAAVERGAVTGIAAMIEAEQELALNNGEGAPSAQQPH